MPDQNPVARLRIDLKTWRAAWLASHPDPVDQAHEERFHVERFRAFPPLALHRQARGDGRVFVAMLVEAGYLRAVDG